MKTTIIIRKNAQTSTGYELVNGNGNVLPIESTYKGEPNTLVLPENTANRKYCNSKKVDAVGELTLEYKESKHYSVDPAKKTAPKKGWEDYLDEDDKKVLEELKAKAEAKKKAEKEAAEAAKNDPIAKAKRELEKAQKRVNELKAQIGLGDEDFEDDTFGSDLGELDDEAAE